MTTKGFPRWLETVALCLLCGAVAGLCLWLESGSPAAGAFGAAAGVAAALFVRDPEVEAASSRAALEEVR